MKGCVWFVAIVWCCWVYFGVADAKRVRNELPPPPKYETKYFSQYLDHFNFATNPQYFQQRYLIADQYWNGNYPGNCPGPIFFYTGNESPVTDYYEASGFFTQVLAPKFNGLLLFAEHRYFGESMPFGNSSFDPGKINFCSAEQALADYAVLITDFKNNVTKARNCPVFAFGGSYGGMLTTWFRLKYPNIVMGGLAASAPFAFVGTGISPYAFIDAASNTFATAGQNCGPTVAAAFSAVQKLAETDQGRAEFTQKFKLCSPLKTKQDALDVIGWISNGLTGMAMLDYPYETNYGISLPGWPVNKTCSILTKSNDPTTLVDRFAAAVGVFYNNTGTWQCYDITKDVPDWGTCCGWDYLACTEMYIPSASGNIFPASPWNLTADIQRCQQQFGVTLRPDWAKTHFGGFDLKAGSNIIFSNGLLDPWHTSGILKNLSDSLVAVVIPAAAHHLDLRAPNDTADPVYVQQARQIETSLILSWLQDYWKQFSSQP